MRDDDPADAGARPVRRGAVRRHPLGRPVIGSVRDHRVADPRPGRRLLPAPVPAGRDGRRGRRAARARRGGAAGARGVRRPAGPATRRRCRRGPARGPAGAPARRVAVIGRPTEQAHLVPRRHRRWPGPTSAGSRSGVLNNALGGGMSSRLFQEIREKRGLAYSVYSFSSQYADAGQFGVVGRLPPGARCRRCSRSCASSWPRSPSTASPTRSSRAARVSSRGGLVLGLEDTGSRMSRIGKGELAYGEVRSGRRAAGPGRRGHPRGGPRGGRGRAAATAVPRRGRAVRRVRVRRRPGLIALPPILVEPTHREVPRRSQRQDRRRRGCRRVPA